MQPTEFFLTEEAAEKEQDQEWPWELVTETEQPRHMGKK